MEIALRPLSESEAKGLTFDVEPKSVRLVLPRLLSFFAVRNDWAYRIITCDDAMWEEMQAAGAKQGPGAAQQVAGVHPQAALYAPVGQHHCV